jgi:hypothetical protein
LPSLAELDKRSVCLRSSEGEGSKNRPSVFSG